MIGIFNVAENLAQTSCA